MGISGTWPDPLPGYEEVLPAPPDTTELQAGDILLVTYRLVQAGEWLVYYQVSRIEDKLAEDARFRIEAWAWDREALTITFKVTLREQPTEKVVFQEAGFGGRAIAIAVALIAGAAWGFLCDSDKIIRLFRGQTRVQQTVEEVRTINADPDLTEEQKRVLTEAAINNGGSRADTGLVGLLLWGGLAVLFMIWLGVER